MTKDNSEIKNWDKDLNKTFDFHDINPQHWTNVNDDIVQALKVDGVIPPVTFAAHATLNHLESELEYELLRMKQRMAKEDQYGVAYYFRSTYPKYIIWMLLCQATVQQKLLSVTSVSEDYGLSETAVRSIFEEATDSGYAHKTKVDRGYWYCATNITMRGYVKRLQTEAMFHTEQKMDHLQTFKSFLKYLPAGDNYNKNNWFDLTK